MTNRKRGFKKLMVCLMILTMLCGTMLATLSVASAAQVPANPISVMKIGVSKTLTTTSAGVWPAQQLFTFNVAANNYTGTAGLTAATMPLPILTSMQLASGTANAGTSQTVETQAGNLAAITFTQPGIYTYQVTEATPASGVAGLTYDNATYFVNVYVGYVIDDVTNEVVLSGGNPMVTITNVTVYKNTNPTDLANAGGTQPAGSADADGKMMVVTPDQLGTNANPTPVNVPFTNKYEAQSLSVSKKVTGSLGSLTDPFAFSITLNTPSSAADTNSYPYTITNSDGAVASQATIRSGGTFSLSHGQSIEITGLPIGEVIAVTETGAADYTTAAQPTFGTAGTTVNGKAVTGTIAAGTNNIDFTNNKDAVTPTGVWMDIWPYILIAVLAIGGLVAWIVVKKNRKQQPTEGGQGL